MYATEKNIAEGFKAVGERIDEIEKDTTMAVKELAETIKAIQQQQKSVSQCRPESPAGR